MGRNLLNFSLLCVAISCGIVGYFVWGEIFGIVV